MEADSSLFFFLSKTHHNQRWSMWLTHCIIFLLLICLTTSSSVYMCFVVTCWERADLLALVCGVFCEFVTFPLVSWVRCGTWLYRFLIFATLLTLYNYYLGRYIFTQNTYVHSRTVKQCIVSIGTTTLPRALESSLIVFFRVSETLKSG